MRTAPNGALRLGRGKPVMSRPPLARVRPADLPPLFLRRLAALGSPHALPFTFQDRRGIVLQPHPALPHARVEHIAYPFRRKRMQRLRPAPCHGSSLAPACRVPLFQRPGERFTYLLSLLKRQSLERRIESFPRFRRSAKDVFIGSIRTVSY